MSKLCFVCLLHSSVINNVIDRAFSALLKRNKDYNAGMLFITLFVSDQHLHVFVRRKSPLAYVVYILYTFLCFSRMFFGPKYRALGAPFCH